MSTYIAKAAYRAAKRDLSAAGYDIDKMLDEAGIEPTIRKP